MEDRAWRRDLAREAGDDVDEDTAAREDDELAALDASEDCWDVLSYAWRSVTSGAMWQADTERFGGLLGWARAVEVTHGVNGWHVHVHVLLCFREQVSADLTRAALGPRIFGRGPAPLNPAASPPHRSTAGTGAARSSAPGTSPTTSRRWPTRSSAGTARKATATAAGPRCNSSATPSRPTKPATWPAGGNGETASDGRRQLTWSTGRRDLRALAGLGKEASDEEIAAEDQEADERIAIPRDSWAAIVAGRQETALLAAAERDGPDGARTWLTRHGLPWYLAELGDGPPREVMQPHGWRADARSVLRVRRLQC